MVLAETGCNFVCVKPLRQNDLYTIDICTCFSDVPVICVSPVSILCRCQHPVYFDQQLKKSCPNKQDDMVIDLSHFVLQNNFSRITDRI